MKAFKHFPNCPVSHDIPAIFVYSSGPVWSEQHRMVAVACHCHHQPPLNSYHGTDYEEGKPLSQPIAVL